MPPSTRVQFILGEEGEDDGAHESQGLGRSGPAELRQKGCVSEWA